MNNGRNNITMLVCTLLMTSALVVSAQTYAEADMSKRFFEMDEFTAPTTLDEDVVQRDAQFTGGMKALHNHLVHHFNYPEADRQNGIEGKVIAKFVIDENGQVESARIVRSVSETIDSALLLAIETMPAWKPAIRDGQPVKSYVTLPFKASLR